MHKRSYFFTIGAMLALSGCLDTTLQSGERSSGTEGVEETGEVVDVLRIDVQRHGDELELVGGGSLRLPADKPPLRSDGGQYAVVAYDANGQAVDSAWLDFPTEIFEHSDDDGGGEVVVHSFDDAVSTAYLHGTEPIRSVQVLDWDGNVVLEHHVTGLSRLQAARPDYVEDFEARFPQIKFWIPGDGLRAGRISHRPVLMPTEEEVRVISNAVDALPDTLRSALSGMVITDWIPSPGITPTAQTHGYLIGWRRPRLAGRPQNALNSTMHHEAVHAMTNLIDRRTATLGELDEDWVREVQNDWTITTGPFHRAWCRLHNVAIAAGLSVPYYKERGGKPGGCRTNGQRLSNVQARRQGFAGRYGQSYPREDAADFAAKVVWGAARGGELPQCEALRSGDKVGEILTYAKIRLLADFGMIDTASLERCLGASWTVDATPGIHLSTTKAASSSVSYALDQDVWAGYDDSVGGWETYMTAGDGLSRAEIIMPVPVSYYLTSIDSGQVPVVNRAQVTLDQGAAGEYVAYDHGMVIVDYFDGFEYGGEILLAGRAVGEDDYDEIVLHGHFYTSNFVEGTGGLTLAPSDSPVSLWNKVEKEEKGLKP